MKKSTKDLLLWISILPGALIAGALATFPLHWLLELDFAKDGELFGFIDLPPGSNVPIEHLLYPFVIAVVFVYVGFKIAPNYKFLVSIFLAILYILFEIVTIIFVEHSGFKIFFGLRTFSPILGLIVALCVTWQESRKDQVLFT